MIAIQIECGGGDALALAELIASTLHGQVTDPQSSLAYAGKLVREQQERAERERPSRDRMKTIDFMTIDADSDWTDV